VWLVVSEVDRWNIDRAQSGELAQQMLRGGRRQHAEAVDFEQGAKKLARIRHVVCQDQAEDPVHRD